MELPHWESTENRPGASGCRLHYSGRDSKLYRFGQPIRFLFIISKKVNGYSSLGILCPITSSVTSEKATPSHESHWHLVSNAHISSFFALSIVTLGDRILCPTNVGPNPRGLTSSDHSCLRLPQLLGSYPSLVICLPGEYSRRVVLPHRRFFKDRPLLVRPIEMVVG